MAKVRSKKSIATRTFGWFGSERNSRSIATLIAIGAVLGAIFTFAFDKIIPTFAPEWSLSAFGEGYRRGRREMELEFRLQHSEQAARALRERQKIDEWVRSLTDEQLVEELNKWTRKK